MTRSKRDVAYLRSVLKMNPLNDSKTLLAYRKAYLLADGSAPVLAEENEASPARLEELSQQIDELRASFWTLERGELHRRLGELDVGLFPQLSVAIDRLRTVADRRDAFMRFERHPSCFPEFLDAFRRVVVAAPGQAAEMRRSALHAARTGHALRSPTEHRKAARVVLKKFPELAVLEEDWLTQLTEKRAPRRQSPERSEGVPRFISILIVMVILGVLRALLLDR